MPVRRAAALRIGLGLPGTTEGVHFGLPTLLVAGKRFATLDWPDKACLTLNLTPDIQQVLVAAEPAVFVARPDNWGLRGHTEMHLKAADAATVRSGLLAAWRKAAPKRLLKEMDAAPEAPARPKPRRPR